MNERDEHGITGEPGLSTRCVHAGETTDDQGAIHTALYNHSTFAFQSTEDLLDVVEGRTVGNLYTRYGLNPTVRSLESKLELQPMRLASPMYLRRTTRKGSIVRLREGEIMVMAAQETRRITSRAGRSQTAVQDVA